MPGFSPAMRELQAARGVCGFFTIILLLLAFFNIGASYLFLFLSFSSSLAVLILYWKISVLSRTYSRDTRGEKIGKYRQVAYE